MPGTDIGDLVNTGLDPCFAGMTIPRFNILSQPRESEEAY